MDIKLSQLIADLEVSSCTASPDLMVTGLCCDSRTAGPGQLFVAVRGFAFDGHRFITSAVQAGCAAVVCEEKPEGQIPYILVKDSRRALAQLSNAWFGRPGDGMKLIGVTGTNGKTTVTTLIKQLVEKSEGVKAGLIGTNLNMIGERSLPAERTTPESYEVFHLLAQMRDAGCAYAVMEVSSHSIALDRIYGLSFETAIFTNLTRDHLDFHKTMEEYARVKSLLFDRCKTAVINCDDPCGMEMVRGKSCRVITYSAKSDDGDLAAKNIRLAPQKVEFAAVTKGGICRAGLNIPGMFSVYNALAALGCGLSLGYDLNAAAAVLKSAGGVKGRAEVVPVPADYTVLIDYAHSPDSMINILDTVHGACKGRVIGLFGCGGDRDRTKRPIMGRAGGEHADVCVVTTDNPRSERPGAIIEEILPGLEGTRAEVHVVEDRREAIRYALALAKPNDVVVLMGKGHETYQEVCGEKLHLDEREEIAAYYARKD